MRREIIALSVLLAILSFVSSAFNTCELAAQDSDTTVPIFDGLGSFGRKVTTSSADAQKYFDQGLGFLYAFNHDEAIRSFKRAAELDPQCAIAREKSTPQLRNFAQPWQGKISFAIQNRPIGSTRSGTCSAPRCSLSGAQQKRKKFIAKI